MTTYEIIKSHLTKGMRPGSFGYHMQVGQAALITMKLVMAETIRDSKASRQAIDNDPDVIKAISQSQMEKELKKAGVLRE